MGLNPRPMNLKLEALSLKLEVPYTKRAFFPRISKNFFFMPSNLSHLRPSYSRLSVASLDATTVFARWE